MPTSWRKRLRSLARAARTIAGAPDYERYIAHVRTHHAAETPMSYEDFVRARLRDRYERPGSKCC